MRRLIMLFIGWLLAASLGAVPPDVAGKEAIARTVFERLVAARGQAGVAAPTFVFSSAKRNGAWCAGNTVVLEEAAYDVCAKLPDPEAALAGLLAHELVHYFAGHTRTDTIGMLAAAAEIQQESEADYVGGFLAYLAGYPTADLMPQILDGIYAAYGLPDTLTGYPTLAERKELAARGYDRMQSLIAVFEMANALTALERYAEAGAYYDYLLEAFPSREMYNNTGVLYAKAALLLFQPGTLRFVFPVELDMRSRLGDRPRGIGIDTETRNFYLDEARDNFERARLLDAEYPPALVNLATTHALMRASLLEGEPSAHSLELAEDRYLEARLRAREAIRLAEATDQQQSVANARQVLGILAAERGDTAGALLFFQEGAGSPVAKANICLLQTGKFPAVQESQRQSTYTLQETIGAVLPSELPSPDLNVGKVIPVHAGADPTVLTSYSGSPRGSAVLRHTTGDTQADNSLWIMIAGAEYGGATAMEIRIGSQGDDVSREYGAPGYRLITVGGELWVYHDPNIIFSLRGDRVCGWMLFEER